MDYEDWLYDEGGSMKMKVFGRGALSVCSNIWRRIRCSLSSAYKKLLRHKKIEADTVDDGIHFSENQLSGDKTPKTL